MSKRWLRALLAVVCLAAILFTDTAPLFRPQPVSAASEEEIEEKRKEKERLEREKRELQEKLKALQGDKSDMLARKEILDSQIAIIRSEIEITEEQITLYEEKIGQTEVEIADTQEKHADQYALFCARVRAMEERGTVSYWSVLFRATSFADLLASIDFINEIMESDQQVIDDLKDTEDRLTQQQEQLETELAEQETAREELAARNSELKEQIAEAQQIINKLTADEEEYKKLIKEKEAAAAREQAEIVRLSRELAEQQRQGEATLGGYIWPCSSHYVTSPLGSRYTGIAGASTNHQGIDIGRVGYDTKVVASKAGTVIISGYNKYRGNYVVVSHGSGNTTTYQHLSKRLAAVGDKLDQGQVLGITGDTGVSSGPHLHFEITENGEIVDPLKYLTNYIKGW